MHRYAPHLSWIDAQQERMRQLVAAWAQINSGSRNVAGLEACSRAVAREFEPLGGELAWLDLDSCQTIDSAGTLVQHPLGRAIQIRKRPQSPLRVFLGIHLDTVFPADHPFQAVTSPSPDVMQGPGVADAKGGIAVMLVALQALERSDDAHRLGWEVLLNPDEELGSPGSSPLLAAAAARNHLGLLFEPSLPNGVLVGARKGSGSFTAVVRGRSAHAGREPQLGRNAIHALADVIADIAALNGIAPGLTANVGRVEGGVAGNVVPDLAMARFNVRVSSVEEQRLVQDRLQELTEAIGRRDGISLQIHGGFTSPPKPLETRGLILLEHVAACGRDLGLAIEWSPSGGVCDGNKLAAAGLPNVDSLGVRGGNLHSPAEYMITQSLTERASLAALLLLKLAAGEIAWPLGPGDGTEVPS